MLRKGESQEDIAAEEQQSVEQKKGAGALAIAAEKAWQEQESVQTTGKHILSSSQEAISISENQKTLRRGTVPAKLKSINLSDIMQKENNLGTLDFTGYKILGDGDVKQRITIIASAASASAIKKVAATGGQIMLPELKEKKAEVKKAEAKKEQNKEKAK